MANRNLRTPENVPGRFYVDDSCIDCDLCRTAAPNIYQRHDENGYTIVARQPVTDEELQGAVAGLESCPTDSIGDDGVDLV